MKRTIIESAGAVVALGFLAASAVANYLFGASLGRTPWEAELYGTVGVLAVAVNALAPFFMSWSLAASRKIAAASIALMWLLCITYSTTSALGFAAQNREGIAVSRRVTHEAYEDTRRELLNLETRSKEAKPKERIRLEAKIDDARKRLVALRSDTPAPVDAQSQFLSALSRGYVEPRDVRVTLVALFAVMVEVCATLGLFAALSHSSQTPNTPFNPSTPVSAPILTAPQNWQLPSTLPRPTPNKNW
jgi:hypothetical protein